MTSYQGTNTQVSLKTRLGLTLDAPLNVTAMTALTRSQVTPLAGALLFTLFSGAAKLAFPDIRLLQLLLSGAGALLALCALALLVSVRVAARLDDAHAVRLGEAFRNISGQVHRFNLPLMLAGLFLPIHNHTLHALVLCLLPLVTATVPLYSSLPVLLYSLRRLARR